MKVIFAAGGTGGHIYPALACARVLTEQDEAEVLFIGTKSGLESTVVPQAGYKLETIEASGFKRALGIDTLQTAFTAFKGTVQSLRLLSRFRPDIVVGTGAYVSGPVLLSAVLLRYQTLIHEQNVYPGITNRILSVPVDRILAANEEAREHFPRCARSKAEICGNPIRPGILNCSPRRGREILGLDCGPRTLLVMGGSQGAKTINENVLPLYHRFLNLGLQLIHQTGKRDYERVLSRLKKEGLDPDKTRGLLVLPYLDENKLAAALAASDLILCRAGAMTLAEITACGLPSVLIPYPHATHGHQRYNAMSLKTVGACTVITEDQLSENRLFAEIKGLLTDTERLTEMAENSRRAGRPDAVYKFRRAVVELAEESN